MHPLVRDLYKRVLHVGRDYPTGLDHVKQVWKKALRNAENCPSCFSSDGSGSIVNDLHNNPACQEELLHAVHRGRVMVKEMMGVIQLKKYRAMKQRYSGGSSVADGAGMGDDAMLLRQAVHQVPSSPSSATSTNSNSRQ